MPRGSLRVVAYSRFLSVKLFTDVVGGRDERAASSRVGLKRPHFDARRARARDTASDVTI